MLILGSCGYWPGDWIRCWISTRFSCFMNSACFWLGRALVRPSATISVVDTYSILIFLLATSWRSQCWWISICLSLVTSLGESLIMSLTVWRLSQLTVRSWSISRSNSLKKRPYQSSQAKTWDRAKSSALVVEVVTVACFLLCQSIIPPNSLNRKPSVLWRVVGSSANTASLEAVNTGFVGSIDPNSST